MRRLLHIDRWPAAHSRPRIFRGLAFRWIAFRWIALALLAVGCGDDPSMEPAVQRGKTLYGRVCATCHGSDARGMPSLGKSLRDSSFSQSLSDDELADFLKSGRSASHPLNQTGIDMPPKGGDPSISDEDLADLVAFLRTL